MSFPIKPPNFGPMGPFRSLSFPVGPLPSLPRNEPPPIGDASHHSHKAPDAPAHLHTDWWTGRQEASPQDLLNSSAAQHHIDFISKIK